MTCHFQYYYLSLGSICVRCLLLVRLYYAVLQALLCSIDHCRLYLVITLSRNKVERETELLLHPYSVSVSLIYLKFVVYSDVLEMQSRLNCFFKVVSLCRVTLFIVCV